MFPARSASTPPAAPPKGHPTRLPSPGSVLADQAGLSADTVRYYERVGLLPEPARSAAGYRHYDRTPLAECG